MIPTTGMSRSCMGRTSTRANASSSFTLDTPAHLACKFQILPGFALVGRGTQKISRMIGDDQGHLREAELVHLLAQAPQCLVGAQQILRSDAPDDQHDLWFQQRNLPFQER